MLAGRVWRDDGFAAALDEPVPQLAGVIGPIGQQLARCRHEPEYGGGSDQVVGVACGQDQSPGAAQLVGQRVDFGRSPATGGSDGVVEGPPFAPAAERCAFT